MPVDNKTEYDDYYSRVDFDKRHSLAARYIQYLYGELLTGIDRASFRKVVDVGCGEGGKTRNLLELFPRASVAGLDFSSAGIDFAKKTYSDPRLEYICVDAESAAEYLKGGVDMVVSSYTLEHIQNWRDVIASWAAAKIPWVLCCVPAGRMWRQDRREHYLHFKNGLLESSFKDLGYDVVKKFYWGFPFYHPLTKIALNINLEGTRRITTSRPSALRKFIEDTLYFLYTRATSKTIGGDLFALFHNPRFDAQGFGKGGRGD